MAGVGLGCALLAYDSLLKGLGKLEINADLMRADLDANWELLTPSPSRPSCAFTRGCPRLRKSSKELTRGTRSPGGHAGLVASLEIPDAAKAEPQADALGLHGQGCRAGQRI